MQAEARTHQPSHARAKGVVLDAVLAVRAAEEAGQLSVCSPAPQHSFKRSGPNTGLNTPAQLTQGGFQPTYPEAWQSVECPPVQATPQVSAKTWQISGTRKLLHNVAATTAEA